MENIGKIFRALRFMLKDDNKYFIKTFFCNYGYVSAKLMKNKRRKKSWSQKQ